MTDWPASKRVKVSRVGSTATLALASNKVNSLDPEVLGEITAFIEYCEQEADINALVVTGEGSVFSAGLNVTDVLANDASYTAGLLDALHETLVRVFACPIPTVVAVNGPAIAGGCLLACAFDKRLIAEEARIGVTELNVGVAFPMVAVELLRHVCGRQAEPLMLDAELLSAADACRIGLTHQSLPTADLQAAAIAAAEKLASLDPGAYALAKVSSRRAVLATIDGDQGRALDRQVRHHWQSDPTRANLQSLLKPKD